MGAVLPLMKLSVPARMRGMTLLEMLLVVALIATVGIVTAGALSRGSAGMQLRGSGKDIANALRMTRAQAIASGEPRRFVIAAQGHHWQGGDGRQGDLPERLQVRFEGATQLQEGPDQGVIEFHPDGASSGGRIDLAVGAAVWRVDVGWLTGEVTSGPGPAR